MSRRLRDPTPGSTNENIQKTPPRPLGLPAPSSVGPIGYSSFWGLDQHETLILDVRERLACIETKLDGHNEAHNTINKRLDGAESRSDAHDLRLRVLEQGQAKVYAVAGLIATAVSTFGSSIFEKLMH